MTPTTDTSAAGGEDSTPGDERRKLVLAMARYRRSWLVEKRLTCSSTGCHCRTKGQKHTGLYLRWRESRHCRSLYVRPAYVDAVRAEVADRRKSRKAFWQSVRSMNRQVNRVIDAYEWWLEYRHDRDAGRPTKPLPRWLQRDLEAMHGAPLSPERRTP
jgi:hypothetical protein